MRYMFFYLDITEDIVAQWGVMVDPQVLTPHITYIVVLAAATTTILHCGAAGRDS